MGEEPTGLRTWKEALNYAPSVIAACGGYALALSAVYKLTYLISAGNGDTIRLLSFSDFLDGSVVTVFVATLVTIPLFAAGAMRWRSGVLNASLKSIVTVLGTSCALIFGLAAFFLSARAFIAFAVYWGSYTILFGSYLWAKTRPEPRSKMTMMVILILAVPITAMIMAGALNGGLDLHCTKPVVIKDVSNNEIAGGALLGYSNRGVLIRGEGKKLLVVPWGNKIEEGSKKCEGGVGALRAWIVGKT